MTVKGDPMADNKKYTDLVNPPLSLLIKLGSIAVHVEEMLSPGGHEFDKASIESLLSDPEVKEWIKGMSDLAFMPQKR